MEFYSEELKKIRKAQEITQSSFAKKMEVSPSIIWNWEKGTRNPLPKNVHQMAQVLKVSSLAISDLPDKPIPESEYIFSDTSESERVSALVSEVKYYKAESENRRNILNSLKLVSYHKDKNLKVTYASDYFLQYFNLTLGEVLGRSFNEIFPASDTVANLRVLEQSVLSKSVHEFIRHPLPLPNNRLGEANIELNLKGGVSVVIRDVTVYREEQAKRKNLEKRIDTFSDMVWEVAIKPDGSMQVLSVNEAVEELFGYTKAEFLSPDFDVKCLYRYPETAISKIPPASNNAYTSLTEGKCKSGEFKFIESSYTIDAKDGCKHLFIISKDVTERKKLDEERSVVHNYLQAIDTMTMIGRRKPKSRFEEAEIYFTSRNIKKLFGFTATQYQKNRNLYYDAVVPEDRERVKLFFESDLFETFYYRINVKGKIKHLRHTRQKLGTYVASTVDDITTNQEKESVIKMLTTAINKSDSVYWLLDQSQKKYVFISDGAKKTFGRSAEYFKADNPLEKFQTIVHPDDRHLFKAYGNDETPAPPTNYRIIKNGKVVHISSIISHLPINGKKHILYINTDITDSVEVYKERSILIEAINKSKQTFIVGFRDGDFKKYIPYYCSKNVSKLFGITATYAMKHNEALYDVIVPEDRERVRNRIESPEATIKNLTFRVNVKGKIKTIKQERHKAGKYLFSKMEDITHERETADHVKQLERGLSEIGTAVWCGKGKGLDIKITHLNDVWKKKYGISSAKLKKNPQCWLKQLPTEQDIENCKNANITGVGVYNFIHPKTGETYTIKETVTYDPKLDISIGVLSDVSIMSDACASCPSLA